MFVIIEGDPYKIVEKDKQQTTESIVWFESELNHQKSFLEGKSSIFYRIGFVSASCVHFRAEWIAPEQLNKNLQ